tara:strand:- start:202 stop:522 length:321 start_codon:yes stop_codon:yes gene_type:complete
MKNKTEPTWSGTRVLEEAENFFNTFVEVYEGKDPGEITLGLLREICTLKASQLQVIEAIQANSELARAAADNSHIAVQKFQELEATMKSQGRNFSERLERLEARSG